MRPRAGPRRSVRVSAPPAGRPATIAQRNDRIEVGPRVGAEGQDQREQDRGGGQGIRDSATAFPPAELGHYAGTHHRRQQQDGAQALRDDRSNAGRVSPRPSSVRQAAGFRARTKALMNFPSTCGESASTSRPAGPRTSAHLPGCTRGWARPSRPRSPRWPASRYSDSSSAPATQPTQSSMFRRTSAGTSPCTTTSETANRPPGLRTRNASREHAVLVRGEVDDAVGDHHVDRSRREGECLDLALQELDVLDARFRWFSRASASISSVMSSP